MPRLTITLSDKCVKALKRAAAERDTTMRQLVELSLEMNGIKSRKVAAGLVAEARRRAGLTEADAMSQGVKAARRVRRI